MNVIPERIIFVSQGITVYTNAAKMHCSHSKHSVKNFIMYRLGSKS